MFLLPLQLWHAAVPVTEIEMPPRMVVGDGANAGGASRWQEAATEPW